MTNGSSQILSPRSSIRADTNRYRSMVAGSPWKSQSLEARPVSRRREHAGTRQHSGGHRNLCVASRLSCAPVFRRAQEQNSRARCDDERSSVRIPREADTSGGSPPADTSSPRGMTGRTTARGLGLRRGGPNRTAVHREAHDGHSGCPLAQLPAMDQFRTVHGSASMVSPVLAKEVAGIRHFERRRLAPIECGEKLIVVVSSERVETRGQ